MKTKKVYLATPVGDPTEIDIRRKAEQAKKILETTYDNVTNPFTMVGWGLQIPRFYRSNIFP